MQARNLQKVLAMILATSAFGARGLACGPCNDTTSVIPLVPPSSDGGVEDAGDWMAAECDRLCPNPVSCTPQSITLEDGTVVPAIECVQPGDCGAGRRPLGYAEPPCDWLTRATLLEAASVRAFQDLRRDLAALGAPQSLRRRASRAARDEQRHARRMRALARGKGARVPKPLVEQRKTISIEELATQNAVEGCVREAFGALVAAWQGEHAADREVRAAMARIAIDEAEHAALAFQVDGWLMKRLDPGARARVEAARRQAARALSESRPSPDSNPLSEYLGLPDPKIRAALARELFRALDLPH